MARSFNGTSSDSAYFALPSSLTTLSYFCWLNANSFPSYQAAILNQSSSTADNQLSWSGTLGINTSGNIVGYAYDPTATAEKRATGATALSTGVWYPVGVSMSVSDGIRAWVNGSSDGSQAVSSLYDFGATQTYLTTGFQTRSFTGNSPGYMGQRLDGTIAEIGVWDRVLSSDEWAALARGVLPWRIGASLKHYAPFWGVGADLVTGTTGGYTITGTSRANHAPVVPFTRRVPTVFDLGGGGGGSFQPAWAATQRSSILGGGLR